MLPSLGVSLTHNRPRGVKIASVRQLRLWGAGGVLTQFSRNYQLLTIPRALYDTHALLRAYAYGMLIGALAIRWHARSTGPRPVLSSMHAWYSPMHAWYSPVQVAPDTPAAAAKVSVGDVIVAVNGNTVTDNSSV